MGSQFWAEFLLENALKQQNFPGGGGGGGGHAPRERASGPPFINFLKMMTTNNS